MRVGDDQRHAAQADDLAPPLCITGCRDYRRDGYDAPALALAQASGIEPKIWPFPRQRPVEEAMHRRGDRAEEGSMPVVRFRP